MAKKEKYLNNTFIKIYSIIQKMNLKKLKEIMYYIDRIMCLFIRKEKKIKSKKEQVLIIFNLALGDGIVFFNALSKIREKFSKDKYNLDIVCQKGLEILYLESNLFDEVIPLNFTKSTVNLKERFKTIKKIRSKYYDLVLDPVGANECFTNVLMSRNINSQKKIGCIIDSYSGRCSEHILKNTYDEIKVLTSKTLIEQYYEFFYDNYIVEFCNLPFKKNNLGLPKKYFIVFPSASQELKKWPIERYAKLIKKIYNKIHIPLVFCGTSTDKSAFESLASLVTDVPIIDIMGKTSMLEFIDVIKNASIVVTNDTSTYHIAVIVQTPVAIITGGYTYDRYVSYKFLGNEKYRLPYIVVNHMDCFNCINNCSKIKKEEKIWPCLNKITVDYAWSIIEKMIDKEVK